jgi:hypothetical protein
MLWFTSRITIMIYRRTPVRQWSNISNSALVDQVHRSLPDLIQMVICMDPEFVKDTYAHLTRRQHKLSLALQLK